MVASSLVVLSDAFLKLTPAILGRLVTSTKFPGEDFWPESYLDSEISRCPFSSLRAVVGSSKYAGVEAKLSQFITDVANHNKIELSAREAIVYNLFQPTLHLSRLCEDLDTKKWIETTLRRWPIYMIVGLITVIEPYIKRENHEDTGATTLFTNVHTHDTSIVLPPSAADLLGFTTQDSVPNQTDSKTSFPSPNERVVGVRYQQLKFRLLPSQKGGETLLETYRNRWILVTWEHDGSDDLLEAGFEESIDVDNLEWGGELNKLSEVDIQVGIEH